MVPTHPKQCPSIGGFRSENDHIKHIKAGFGMTEMFKNRCVNEFIR